MTQVPSFPYYPMMLVGRTTAYVFRLQELTVQRVVEMVPKAVHSA